MVKYISKAGANYLVSDHKLQTEKVPYAGIEIGTKVTKIGSKKRSSFEIKEGFYMRYDGKLFFDSYEYLVFRTPFMDESIQEKWYCYVFNVVTASKLLMMSKDCKAASDIDVDSFIVF
jgi:hypothetical protein